ncbi:ABC transporter permease [Blautia schinkii]|nr:ABC transporter permease [Blautia schinkii]
MDKNNNGGIVRRIADKSMKNNRARNFFTCLTIALSVALVLTFILYIFGSSKEKLRLQEDSPQVSYLDVTPEQAEAIKANSAVKWVGTEKKVGSSKVGNSRLTVFYQDDFYMDKDKIEYTGELPRGENEIMVPRDYLEQLGLDIHPGDAASLDLGDKTVREYKITAIAESPSKAKNSHKIFVSLPCALLMTGQSEETVDAIVNMQGAMDMDYDIAQESAAQIGGQAGVSEDQIKVNDVYFSQSNISKLTPGSIMTLALVALLILSAAGIVIHNIFYISVAGKVREYGQLRTIGMTRKQVRRMISREGRRLALCGIPFGLVLGGVMGYALVPGGWDFLNFAGAALVCSLLGIVFVGISVRKPGKIAAMTSPVEALGYTGYTGKEKASKELQRSLTPENLAALNLRRNRKKSILTMCSLVLAGILMGAITSFVVSYDPAAVVDNSYPDGDYQLQLSAESGYTNNDTSLLGRAKAYASLQAADTMGEDLREELEGVDGVTGVKPWHYLMIATDIFGEPEEMSINGFTEEDFELLKQMNYEGETSYQKLAETPGVIVEIEYNSNFEKNPVKVGDKFPVVCYNGKGEMIETDLPVLGTIRQKTWSSDNRKKGIQQKLPLSIMGSTLMMPVETMNEWAGMNTTYGYEIAVSPDKEAEVGKTLEELYGAEENMYLGSKREIKESREQEEFSMKVILYVLAAFLVIFGLINLMNTIMTNLFSRKRELGILQAVGMTKVQIRRMLSRETLSYVALSVFCAAAVGGALGYALVRVAFIMQLWVKYQYPWIPVLVYIVALCLMQWGMTRYGVKMLQKESLVDRMKEN